MADHRAPDYELADTFEVDRPTQFQALFDETRITITELLLERAATIKELAETLGKPKGTIGHHVGVLEDTGLIRVVRTEKVRAIEAKYYGRVARTYVLTPKVKGEHIGIDLSPAHSLTTAAAEYTEAARREEDGNLDTGPLSTLRRVRIPDSRAAEWTQRLKDLIQEFTAEERGGETTYGLVIAFYPTDRPHLPDPGASA